MTVVLDQWESATWLTAEAEASVVVATHNRSRMLAELVDALEQQDGVALEVVIVDDGSTDETPRQLRSIVGRTQLPLLALRTPGSGGPSEPRNIAAGRARSGYLLFTDDDCLPRPDWARRLLEQLRTGATVVQGRTLPEPGGCHGPWDRGIWVESPGPLFETCNIGYDRTAFLVAGGFPLLDLLPRSSLARGFGEDAALGAAVARRGRSGWAPDAVVHHRWLPGSYRDHLRGRRRLAGFAGLARAVPEVADALPAGVFLSTRTLLFDVAVAGLATAAVTRRPHPTLLMAPWVVGTWRRARDRPGRSIAVRMAQLAVADVVGLGSLIEGSIRARRPVL